MVLDSVLETCLDCVMGHIHHGVDNNNKCQVAGHGARFLVPEGPSHTYLGTWVE